MSGEYMNCLAAYGVSSAHPGSLGLTRRMLDRERIHAGAKVLDAGCGTGGTAELLIKSYKTDVTALDLHPVMVEKAKQRLIGKPVEIIQGDIENLSLKSGTFDLVLSESVLAFTKVEQSLHHISRILKNEGVLLAVEMVKEDGLLPDHIKELREFYSLPELYGEGEWIHMFKSAGFDTVECLYGLDGISTEETEITPEFMLSEILLEEHHDTLERHLELNDLYQDLLGFRVFRCTKKNLK
ncbi:class I SAM-dependent methyltransferase [Aciduricibacillus chroicocephali]|uniref:Class I SAM-dependent methyltransferase n=1 Tax=Aciduricibacillus chroicocephali TaxID=3054939 RepID=A0ABY9KW41_9BACI|nr:class I SAM-dependent methyltransferase [Bacillaceae bacterium 44XB]